MSVLFFPPHLASLTVQKCISIYNNCPGPVAFGSNQWIIKLIGNTYSKTKLRLGGRRGGRAYLTLLTVLIATAFLFLCERCEA